MSAPLDALTRAHEAGEAAALLATWRRDGTLRADEAAALLQAVMQARDERKAAGAFYTSIAAARPIARALVEPLRELPDQILEPTCGGGARLVALIEALAEKLATSARDIAPRVIAAELDALGMFIARWRVQEAFGDACEDAITWRTGDALTLEPLQGNRALVLANPPFGNAIEKATGRRADELRALKKRFPLAARGAFDRSALFVELLHQITPPASEVCVILPTAFLAHPSAKALREELARTRSLRAILPLDDDAFLGAAVSTCAIILGEKTTPARLETSFALQRDACEPASPHGTRALLSGEWGKLLHPLTDAFDSLLETSVPLREHVHCTAGATTGEAYDWMPHIVEGIPDPSAKEFPFGVRAPGNKLAESAGFAPLIIAGAIEPHHLLWGKSPTRYLGGTWQFPLISRQAIGEKRAQLSRTPRVHVAGLSRAIEAWADLRGETVGAVSTLSVWPKNSDALSVPVLCAILNSALVRVAYASAFAPLALRGGNTQVTRQKLVSVEVPERWMRLHKPALPADDGRLRPLLAWLREHAIPLRKTIPTGDEIRALQLGAQALRDQFVDNGRPADGEALLVCALHKLADQTPREAGDSGALDLLLLALANGAVPAEPT